MLWVLRCAVVIGIIYWLSPMRTEEAAIRVEDWRGLARVVRDHPEAAGALAREAGGGALSALRRDAAGESPSSRKP